MSEQNKRPLTEAEQLSILHHAITTWREIKLKAYMKLIKEHIEEGRSQNSQTPEQSLAYEKELHLRLTGEMFRGFFDNTDKIKELKEIIANQELPDGYDYTAFFKGFDEYLVGTMSSVFDD